MPSTPSVGQVTGCVTDPPVPAPIAAREAVIDSLPIVPTVEESCHVCVVRLGFPEHPAVHVVSLMPAPIPAPAIVSPDASGPLEIAVTLSVEPEIDAVNAAEIGNEQFAPTPTPIEDGAAD